MSVSHGDVPGLLLLTFLRRSVSEGKPYMAASNLFDSNGYLHNRKKSIAHTHIYYFVLRARFTESGLVLESCPSTNSYKLRFGARFHSKEI